MTQTCNQDLPVWAQAARQRILSDHNQGNPRPMKPCPLELQTWSIENALVTVYIYRPQGMFMFSEASANQPVHGGGGVCTQPKLA